MTYTKAQCIDETKEHIAKVNENLVKMIIELQIRGALHDASKLKEPELSAFTKVNNKLSSLEYGSEEYFKILNTDLKHALSHHYANNSHHPEHYKVYMCEVCNTKYDKIPFNNVCVMCQYDGPYTESFDMSKMDLLDIVEMFCDWQAATQRHETGDINRSIELNMERFKYPPMLAEIFKNTVKYLEPNKDKE